MMTRCPSCGATSSLDVLIQHTEAFNLLARVFQQTAVGNAFLKYLAMHRPANRALSNDRIAKLLGEIVPDFEKQEILRNGKPHPAPTAAWLWAIDEAVKARDNGKLITPLKGHGWLYAVITSYRPEQHAPVQTSPIPAQPRYVADNRAMCDVYAEKALVAKPDESAASPVLAFSSPKKPKARMLKGVPASQLFAHIVSQKQDGETNDECFQRLLKEQENQQGAE
jgi:hypothetical protein